VVGAVRGGMLVCLICSWDPWRSSTGESEDAGMRRESGAKGKELFRTEIGRTPTGVGGSPLRMRDGVRCGVIAGEESGDVPGDIPDRALGAGGRPGNGCALIELVRVRRAGAGEAGSGSAGGGCGAIIDAARARRPAAGEAGSGSTGCGDCGGG